MNCLNHHQRCCRRHHRRRHNLTVVIATVILVIIAAADGGIGDIGGPSRRSPRLVFASALSPPSSSLPESAIRTIRSGGIAIVPDFLGPSDSSRLRRDASDLFRGGRFVVDGDGARDKSKFDPAKDQAVLPSYAKKMKLCSR